MILERPEIESMKQEVLLGEETEPCWKDEIEEYLKTGNLPKDAKKARALRIWVARFILIDWKLYKRGYSQPYLKCLPHWEA